MTRATTPQIGYSLLLFSTLAAAAFIGATAVAVRATTMLPGWVAWSGFAAAGLLLFCVLFSPSIALPLWVLAAGIALWRSSSVVMPAGHST